MVWRATHLGSEHGIAPDTIVLVARCERRIRRRLAVVVCGGVVEPTLAAASKGAWAARWLHGTLSNAAGNRRSECQPILCARKADLARRTRRCVAAAYHVLRACLRMELAPCWWQLDLIRPGHRVVAAC